MSEYQNLLGQAYRAALEPGDNAKQLAGGLGGAVWGDFCRNAADNIVKAANAKRGEPRRIPFCSAVDLLCPSCRANIELEEHPEFDESEENQWLTCQHCNATLVVTRKYFVEVE